MQADPRGSFSLNNPSIPPAPPSGVGSSARSSRGGQGSVSSQVGEALSGKSTPKSLEGSHPLDPAELSHALNRLNSFQHDEDLSEHKKEILEWIKANPEDVKILREAHPEVLKDQAFIAEIREIVSSASDEKGARIKHFTQKTTEHNAFAERLQSAKADMIKNYNTRRDTIEAKHTSAVFKMMSKLHQLESGDQNFLTKYLQKAYIAVKFAIVNIQHDRAISKLENQTFKQTSQLNEKLNHNESLLENLKGSFSTPSFSSLETLEGREDTSSEISSDFDETPSFEYPPEEFERLLENANKALKILEAKKGDIRGELLKETKVASTAPAAPVVPVAPAEPITVQEVRKSAEILQDVLELDQLMLDIADMIKEAVDSLPREAVIKNDPVLALFTELRAIKNSDPEAEDFGERVEQTLHLAEAVNNGLHKMVDEAGDDLLTLRDLDNLVKAQAEDARIDKSIDSMLAQLVSGESEIGHLVHIHEATQILNQLVAPYAEEAKVLSDEVGEVIEQKARAALAQLDVFNQLRNVKLKVSGRREELINPEVPLDKEESVGGIDYSPLPSMAKVKTGRLEELTRTTNQEGFQSIYDAEASDVDFDELLNKLKEGSSSEVSIAPSTEDIDDLFKDIGKSEPSTPRTINSVEKALAELDAILEEDERLGT